MLKLTAITQTTLKLLRNWKILSLFIILRFPDFRKQFHLTTDPSNYYCRPYLYGNRFTIFTYHQPIKYLLAKYRSRDLSPRHQRWLLKLGEYQFDIECLKGGENKVVDYLSRIKHIKKSDELLTETDNRIHLYFNVGVMLNIEDDVSMAT